MTNYQIGRLLADDRHLIVRISSRIRITWRLHNQRTPLCDTDQALLHHYVSINLAFLDPSGRTPSVNVDMRELRSDLTRKMQEVQGSFRLGREYDSVPQYDSVRFTPR